MKELYIIANAEKTVALFVVNKSLSSVLTFDEFLPEEILAKVPDAEKTYMLFEYSTIPVRTFFKKDIRKEAIFMKVGESLPSTNVILKIDEIGDQFIVSVISKEIFNSLRRFNPDYVGSYEMAVLFGARKYYKVPLLFENNGFYFYYGSMSISISNQPDIPTEAGLRIVQPRPDSSDQLPLKQFYSNAFITKPWLSVKAPATKAQIPEWLFVPIFFSEAHGNLLEQKFQVEKNKINKDAKKLIQAFVIVAAGIAITFATRFIPLSLPYKEVATIKIPEEMLVTSTSELEKFVYRKSNQYHFYWVENAIYFVSKQDAINYGKKTNKKVYDVEYNGDTEIGRTELKP